MPELAIRIINFRYSDCAIFHSIHGMDLSNHPIGNKNRISRFGIREKLRQLLNWEYALEDFNMRLQKSLIEGLVQQESLELLRNQQMSAYLNGDFQDECYTCCRNVKLFVN